MTNSKLFKYHITGLYLLSNHNYTYDTISMNRWFRRKHIISKNESNIQLRML